MADGESDRQFRANVAELGMIAAKLGAWEKSRQDDHKEYREDIQDFRSEFRRVHDELAGIKTAVTRTATDMELIAQQVRTSVGDIKELKSDVENLDERVKSLEAGRSRERGAWAVFVLVWTVLGTIGGAALAVVMPNFIPTWLKGGS